MLRALVLALIAGLMLASCTTARTAYAPAPNKYRERGGEQFPGHSRLRGTRITKQARRAVRWAANRSQHND